jgi:RNA polymerase sigma-70 factor (ECF subfamily)
LLARLRLAPADQAAWDEFVARYGRKIYGWCRHWGLQEADAEDVTQEVLLKLSEKMRTFVYDSAGSFRAWLKTLTHHAWQDFVANRRRAGVGCGSTEVLQTLHMAKAREDLLQRLETEFDRELLDTAMQRVRVRVRPHTWEAFRLLAIEALPGAQVAAKLGLKVATAFVARSKVQKMLQEEMHRLERAEPDPVEGTP